MKKSNPLIVCLTNTVAANFTANCLLAIGAKPAMVSDPSEAAELTAAADALLVNLGTVTSSQADAMRSAVRAAASHSVPWVLDPVGLQSLSFRRTLAFELIAHNPSIIRGNIKEIQFLQGSVPTLFQAQIPPLPAFPAILSTAATDTVFPPPASRLPPVTVSGGVPLLQSVTATGCAQGGLCAAFLAWGQTPTDACLSASRLMKRAGERAFASASRPGSFQLALLDALWELTHD